MQVKPWAGVKKVTVDGTACRQVCALPPFACPPSQVRLPAVMLVLNTDIAERGLFVPQRLYTASARQQVGVGLCV